MGKNKMGKISIILCLTCLTAVGLLCGCVRLNYPVVVMPKTQEEIKAELAQATLAQVALAQAVKTEVIQVELVQKEKTKILTYP